MKKRIIIAALATSILTACGAKPTGTPNQDTAKTEAQSTESTSSTTQGQKEQDTDNKPLVEVEEQEIFNQDGIKVTIKGFDQDSTGPYLNVLIENNADKNIIVQTRNSSLNGYMTDFAISCNVAAGKKANDKIQMDLASIELSGIGKIYDIDFDLVVLDENFGTIAENNGIHINRNLSEPYTQTYDDSGTVVYNQNDIKIVWKDFATNDTYSFLLFFIENNTSEEITVQTRDTSVNGFMIEPTISSSVLPGKKAVDVMSFYNTDLEANGITDISNIETSFHIFSSNFTKTVADTDPITITLN
ncbi:MAG: hypothetical protein KIC73_01230 [Clostridiales bacterium]|jgi:hypothetical protein|nr:hypothetical protein [Clostridiales bacterium]